MEYGIRMAPHRKGGKESSQEVEESGRASGQRRIFSSFLVDKSKGTNGETISQRIRWKNIMLEFQKRTNLAWSREELKHKYDGLKVRWALWKKLKGRETGLGWDHEKGTIAASDELWLKKIEEDAKFKQFRDKGIDSELESKMDELFRGHVARGDDIITPNMDPLPTAMEENEDMVYIPSQPHCENNINQPFNIENNNISILGPGVSTW
ncbi:hypothetical protein Cgig2_029778 [Carnegiea gigantea]|uniref:Myb/SANT-like domain-containing protein n=1 Tax=Carnegiea gigantea TaxID=171969 RepID=A0A9Q1GJC3_9CARY|nr:hypothetical protein Cgig2_029778 [Carnegiea gigantea]